LISLQREVRNWRSTSRKSIRKILINNMHVIVLITQLGCPKGTRSTYLEVCDYFDIPTGDETRLEYTKEIKKKKKKKKKKK